MGCDIHCVLQKKIKDQWETIDTDLFGRDYTLFSFLSGVRGYSGQYDNIANHGLPDDFQTKTTSDGMLMHSHLGENFWMGEHSYGHISLEDFCNANTPPEPELGDRFEVEKSFRGMSIEFTSCEEVDEYHFIRVHQQSLRNMYGESFTFTDQNGNTVDCGIQNYRLVFGYDS